MPTDYLQILLMPTLRIFNLVNCISGNNFRVCDRSFSKQGSYKPL
jgi:hypothetical protein